MYNVVSSIYLSFQRCIISYRKCVSNYSHMLCVILINRRNTLILKNMTKKILNEMSPEYINGVVNRQREKFKDDQYMRTISAYDYLKKLRQISEFEKYADEIV